MMILIHVKECERFSKLIAIFGLIKTLEKLTSKEENIINIRKTIRQHISYLQNINNISIKINDRTKMPSVIPILHQKGISLRKID